MNNPQAFPRTQSDKEYFYSTGKPEDGMTLLDYFAAKAMQGICAANPDANSDEVAKVSYKIAEDLLKEREKHIK